MKRINLCIINFLLLLIFTYSKLISNLNKASIDNKILKKDKEINNDIKSHNLNKTSNVSDLNHTENNVVDFVVDNDELKMIRKFKEWHKSNNKKYSLDSSEASKRFNTFKANYKYVTSQNKKNSFVMGLGPFADMDFEEFTKKVLGKGPVGEFAKLINENIQNEVKEIE